jgi:hypothetical protein
VRKTIPRGNWDKTGIKPDKTGDPAGPSGPVGLEVYIFFSFSVFLKK